MKLYIVAVLQRKRELENHVKFKKSEYGNVSHCNDVKERPRPSYEILNRLSVEAKY